jgi:hypothetical protein
VLEPLRLSYGKVLPAAVQDVVQKLHDVFGAALVVTSLDAQGATFHVRGLSHEVVIRTLMARKAEVFGAAVPAGGGCVLGPGDFQVLCPLSTAGADGLTLRYLPNLPDPREFLSGFWYY